MMGPVMSAQREGGVNRHSREDSPLWGDTEENMGKLLSCRLMGVGTHCRLEISQAHDGGLACTEHLAPSTHTRKVLRTMLSVDEVSMLPERLRGFQTHRSETGSHWVGLAWNSLCRSGWTGTHIATCLGHPSAGTQDTTTSGPVCLLRQGFM